MGRTKHLPLGLVLGLFAALSIACGNLSRGFVAADACTHFLYAKYALADPVNLVDVWARPFCTILYAPGAILAGRIGARLTALGVALGCGWCAGAIAKRLKLGDPTAAVLFTLSGPLFFLHSFSVMTELPFALLLGTAFVNWCDRRWWLFALAAGLLPTARPEGFGFVALAGVGLLVERKWIEILVLITPLLVWDIAGGLLTRNRELLWLVHAWPWSARSLYGSGSIFTFVAALPVIVSPLILPAALAGICHSLFARERGGSPRDRMNRFLTAAIPVAVLIGHSLLRRLGLMGTLGEARYLLIAAPFWGVLAADGWQLIVARLRLRRPLAWAAAAVSLPIWVNLVRPCVPIPLTGDWLAARRFADWYRSDSVSAGRPRLIAAHPGVFYFLNLDPTAVGRRDAFTRGVIQRPPPHAVLVWDPIYSPRNADVQDAAEPDAIQKAGWIPDREASDRVNDGLGASDGWRIFLSPDRPAASQAGAIRYSSSTYPARSQ